MFPIIPVIASAAIGGGIFALMKYKKMSKTERENADRRVLEYANELVHQQFQKKLDQLEDSVKNRLIQEARDGVLKEPH